MAATAGFAPIESENAQVLILGTLPSRQSVSSGQYYGNPRNAFWRIMGDLFAAGPDIDYPARIAKLARAGVCVWDVLAAANRDGSLDARIDTMSALPNDFESFFDRHPTVRSIFFNGKRAEELFRRFDCGRFVDAAKTDLTILPSTSPAHAAMSYEEKLKRWVIVQSGATR